MAVFALLTVSQPNTKSPELGFRVYLDQKCWVYYVLSIPNPYRALVGTRDRYVCKLLFFRICSVGWGFCYGLAYRIVWGRKVPLQSVPARRLMSTEAYLLSTLLEPAQHDPETYKQTTTANTHTHTHMYVHTSRNE